MSKINMVKWSQAIIDAKDVRNLPVLYFPVLKNIEMGVVESVKDGKKMAVVVANQLREAQTLKTKLEVPGFRYVEHSTLGNAKVTNGGKRLTLGQYDLTVLLFEKE